MFHPKISIIIPVYNGSNYLAEAIESALAQTYENIEILVINDGSKDDWATEKVALSYWDKINYIYKENWWVSTALNLGIEKATWEYISWLSHDDLYYPNKIQEQVKILEWLENKDTLIYSNLEQIDFNGNIINKSVSQDIENDKMVFSFLIREHGINWCTNLISKRIFDKIWLFNIHYKRIQDYDMWFRIMEKYPVHYINKILFISREHPWQDTNSRNIQDEIDLLDIWQNNIKKFSIIHLYNHSIYTRFNFFKKYIFIYLQMIIVRPFLLFLYRNGYILICKILSKMLNKFWFQIYYLK